MVKIVQLEGTEAQLYTLVAPLAMNPKILKYNNNYPFKTGDSFVWFVAVEKGCTVGFIPVEVRSKFMIVNNYYVNEADEQRLFPLLLKAVGEYQTVAGKTLQAVVMVRHAAYFESEGFKTVKTWKVYLKMEKS